MDQAAMTFRPIGVISTPFRTLDECPRNIRKLDPPPLCRVRLEPAFVPGLLGIDGFSHLVLLYWLHQARPARMVFTPHFADRERGVFATRSPSRPNPIGLAVVALEGIEGSDTLLVRTLDCLDGTPLLDVKPYLVSVDCRPEASMGWLTRPGAPAAGDRP